MIIISVKSNYTSKEWITREDYYADIINELVLPENITTTDIKILSSKINKVYDEAKLDLAFCKRKFDTTDKMRKLTEKQLFFFIKQVTDANGMKMTEKMVEGAVQVSMSILPTKDIIEGKSWENNEHRIMQLLQNTVADPLPTQSPLVIDSLRIIEERLIFIESIVEILKDKSGVLITLEGALKLENNLNRQSM